MSGTQVSAWQTPNELLTSMETPALVQRNQLLNQEAQQTINANEMEQISRASNWVISQDPDNKDPAKQAAAYGAAVKLLRANNFAMKAPEQYPGFDAMQMMARQGTPSAEQFKLGADRAALAALAPGGGGGTGAGSAAPTAPPTPSYGGARNPPVMPPEYEPYFQEASQKTGIPIDVLKAQAAQESGFNPGATGQAGEIGIFQIKPSTGASPGYGMEGVRNPAELRDPRSNILFGAQYLAARAKAAGADFATPAGQAAALRAYNGGGDPNYVANVFRYIPGSGTQAASTTPSAPPGAAPPRPTQFAGPGAPPPPAAATTAPAAYATAPTKEAATAQAIATGKPVLIEGSQGAAALPSGHLVANLPDLPAAPLAQAPASPAASPPPPQVALPPRPPIGQDGLQDYQRQELRQLAALGHISPADFIARQEQMKSHNDTLLQQWQTDVRQAQNDALTRQDKAVTQAREAEQLRLSQVTSQREQEAAQRDVERLRLAQEANDRAGNDPTQHERILNELAPKIKEGTATDAEQRRYAGAYYAMQQNGAQPTTMTGPDGSTIPALITKRVPPAFPEPPGGALPLVMQSPDAAKQGQPTVEQAKATTYANRMDVAYPIMEQLDESALTWGQSAKERAGNFIGYNLNSPDYRKLRIAQEAFLSGVIRQDSGAAVGQTEWDRYAHIYFPMPGDDAETVQLKRHIREVELESMKRAAGPNYKPPTSVTAAKDPKSRPPLDSFKR